MAAKKRSESAARRFELVEGSSAKFWEVSSSGAQLVVRFGRLGTDGQTKAKKLASPAAAEQELEKLIREKTGKGYREVRAKAANAAAAPTTKAAAATQRAAAGSPVHASEKAVLAAYANASGLASVRKGFAKRPEDDQLFALGYPHVRILVAGHEEDANPRKSALANIERLYGPSFRYEWPVETARRMIRAWGVELYTPQYKFTKEGEAAAGRAGPISVDEARAVLRYFFVDNRRPSLGAAVEVVLLLEAELGAPRCVDLMIALLESLPGAAWKKVHFEGLRGTYQLGFMLLRLEAKAQKDARRRLEALWKSRGERAAKAPLSRGLDLVLHAAAGAKRSGLGGDDQPWPALYGHVTDAPDAIVAALARRESEPPDDETRMKEPDARLVFLGGEEAYASYVRAAAAKQFPTAPQQAWMRETFGRIDSPQTARLLKSM